MRKPLIMGLDNPHSLNPRAALLPRPRGGAGHRLFVLSGMTWSEYRTSFDRMNVCDLTDRSVFDERTVLVLGREAWRKIGLPGHGMFDRVFGFSRDTKFVLVPHPSGKNIYYNDPRGRHKVRRLMRREVLIWRRREGCIP